MRTTKRQTFHYSANDAASVLLVGDFTNWRQKPIPMHKRNGGPWTATVELPPGNHYYRFIVDGQWQDDPECTMRVSNPFGSQDMVAQLA